MGTILIDLQLSRIPGKDNFTMNEQDAAVFLSSRSQCINLYWTIDITNKATDNGKFEWNAHYLMPWHSFTDKVATMKQTGLKT